MTNLLILIVVIAIAAVFARYFARTLLDDGYGVSLQHRQPPTSKQPDMFGPRYS